MEGEELEIRVLLRHYWKQDYTATAAANKICEVEGDGVVTHVYSAKQVPAKPVWPV